MSETSLYEFGPFVINAQDRLLFKDGEVVPLAPKVFDILLALVEKSGRVLDKDQLMEEIWPNTFVEEGNLARNISTLRRVLGETEEGHHYIETIPRRGYRFIGKVKKVSEETILIRERSRLTFEQEEYTTSPDQAVAATPLLEAEIKQLPAPQKNNALKYATVGIALLVIGGAAGFLIRSISNRSVQPSFERLTFRSGNLSRARIAKDGQTVVYCATFQGQPPELFMMRLGTPDSRPLGISADILSISSTGQMAILLWDAQRHVSLAQVPLVGGEPRKLLDGVTQADWSSDGRELAIAHALEGKFQIEFPIGHVLYETVGLMGDMRLSPDNKAIAFIEYQQAGPYGITILDLRGKKTTVVTGWPRIQGLCWSPANEEVWFSGIRKGRAPSLYAVDLSGKVRLISHLPGKTAIQDVTQDGRVLLELDVPGNSMMYKNAQDPERDLSWMDGSVARDLTADGKTILFNEIGEAGGENAGIYIRHTDSSSAIRIGEGKGLAISPDEKQVLAINPEVTSNQMILIPTGAGSSRPLERGDIQIYRSAAGWFPDGRRIYFFASEAGKLPRVYVQSVESNEPPKPLLPQGLELGPISPDGKTIAAAAAQNVLLYPVEGGSAVRLKGTTPGDKAIQWSNDGQFIYVARFKEFPGKIFRIEVQTGKRELWKELSPPEPDWFGAIVSGAISPDGQNYAYSYSRVLSTLYLVDGWR